MARRKSPCGAARAWGWDVLGSLCGGKAIFVQAHADKLPQCASREIFVQIELVGVDNYIDESATLFRCGCDTCVLCTNDSCAVNIVGTCAFYHSCAVNVAFQVSL
jgi:hypothetical protein